MPKFHISGSGEPALCNATVKGCPLGEDTAHGEFESQAAARSWAEDVLAREAGGGSFSKSKKPVVDMLSAAAEQEFQEDISMTSTLRIPEDNLLYTPNGYETRLVAYKGGVYRADFDSGVYYELSEDDVVGSVSDNPQAEAWARRHGFSADNSFGSTRERKAALAELESTHFADVSEAKIKAYFPKVTSVYMPENGEEGLIYASDGKHVIEIEQNRSGIPYTRVYAIASMQSRNIPELRISDYADDPKAQSWLDSIGVKPE